MSERERRIQESMERLFREGFTTGWKAFASGRYGAGQVPPPIDVTWDGHTPTFTVRRQQINIQSSGLHLPNGFNRNA